jgi:hypothetical protein
VYFFNRSINRFTSDLKLAGRCFVQGLIFLLVPKMGVLVFVRNSVGSMAVLAVVAFSGCNGSASHSAQSTVLVAPTLVWATPAAVTVGTELGASQLNATAVLPGTTIALPGSLTYTPAAGTVESSVGPQTLSVTFTPYDPVDYLPATATVTLTVNQGTPVITWPTPAAINQRTALTATQLNATSNVPGTFVYTPPAGTVESVAGAQTLSTLFTPTDTKNYTTATASVSLSVSAVTLIVPTITWATPGAITVGTALSAIQLNASATDPTGGATVPGTLVYTPAAGTVESSTGPQTLSVAFTPTDQTKYAGGTASVTVMVNAAGVPAYTFQNVKIIAGGYITGIVMHPAQKGLMYARTDVGGAYRWDSVHSAWIPLTDFVTRANANATGIESIGLDPSDAQRVYLAAGLYTESYGGNCVLFNSHDQGATFSTVNFNFKCGSNDNGRGAGERLAVDPNLSSTVYFGTRQNGLWRSLDTGATWAQVASFPVTATTSGAGVVFELFLKNSASAGSSSKTIYAGVSATGTGTDAASLYVSNDAGVTWAPVPGAPTGLYVSHGAQGPDGNLYFSLGDQIGPSGVSTGKILQYILPNGSNPAGTWNDITPPRANGYQGGYGGISLDPQLPGTIMVSTLDHYYPVGDDLWRSLDYGKTWYSINTVGAKRDVSLSPWVTFGGTTQTNTGNWPTALAIDPFNSDHVIHGNGQTMFTTSNMTASDSNKPSNWTIGAQGVEETVILALASPPSGPANLLSVMGDLDGFQHTDLTKSPSNGMFQTPAFSTGTAIDFAQTLPLNVVRVGYGNNGQNGGYSTDGGATWKPFANSPTGTKNGAGSIAMSADGKTLVWSPTDKGVATAYSTDSGVTWTASAGAPANTTVLSDRVNPKTFYIYDRNAGTLFTSVDSGATFTSAQTGLSKYGSLTVAYDAEGSLYLGTYQGMYHAVKGASFQQITSVQSAYAVTLGAPRPNAAQLTLYVGGQVAGVAGVFRSTDNGASWIRIDDAAHEYGYINALQADERVFGRVYLGTGGRGIVYADSPN